MTCTYVVVRFAGALSPPLGLSGVSSVASDDRTSYTFAPYVRLVSGVVVSLFPPQRTATVGTLRLRALRPSPDTEVRYGASPTVIADRTKV